MLTEINGDITRLSGKCIVMHQANCYGATGGLAGALRRRYSYGFEPYIRAMPDMEALGSVIMGFPRMTSTPHLDDPVIAHVLGQRMPGPNTDLKAVEDALKMLHYRITVTYRTGLEGYRLVAPYKMGCGLGGGNWQEYSALIYSIFPECFIMRNLAIDPLPKPSEPEQELF